MVNSTTVVNILEKQIRHKSNEIYNMSGAFKAIKSKKIQREIDELTIEQNTFFSAEPYLMIDSGKYESERNLYAKREYYKDITRAFFNMAVYGDVSLGSYPLNREDIRYAFCMHRLCNLRVDTPTKLVKVILLIYIHNDAFTNLDNYITPLHKQIYITDDDIREFGQEYNIKELMEFKMEDLPEDWRKEILYNGNSPFTILDSRSIEEQKPQLR